MFFMLLKTSNLGEEWPHPERDAFQAEDETGDEISSRRRGVASGASSA